MHNEHRMKSKACGQSQTIRRDEEDKKKNLVFWRERKSTIQSKYGIRYVSLLLKIALQNRVILTQIFSARERLQNIHKKRFRSQKISRSLVNIVTISISAYTSSENLGSG